MNDLIGYIAYFAVFLIPISPFVLYFIIKAAVRNGIYEAELETKRRNIKAQTIKDE